MHETGTSDMAIEYALRRFTAEEYLRMGDLGIIAPNERVELVDGEIITVSPMGVSHESVVMRLNAFFHARFFPRCAISAQLPVRTDPFSEPEPDVGLLKFREDFYAAGKPTGADTYALIEVADSSLALDRGKKLRNYARARVPEYWIANVRDWELEVYREPNDLGYESRAVFGKHDRIALLAFPDDVIAVSDLLGP